MIGYSKDLKLKFIKIFKRSNLSISRLAKKEKIPKQTLARWIKLYKMFGERGLENRKSGVKETPIDYEFEKLVVKMWEREERSVYRMRLDLKQEGHDISERQIRKIYKKHRYET